MTSNSKNNSGKRKTSERSTKSTSTKRSSKSNTSSRTGRNVNAKSNRGRSVSSNKKKEEEYSFDGTKALILIGVFAAFLLMFIFSLDLFEGSFAVFLCSVFRGLFGINAFLIPVIGTICLLIYLFCPLTKKLVFKFCATIASLFAIGTFAHLFAFDEISKGTFFEMVKLFYHEGKGGGVVFGSIAFLIDRTCGRALIWIIALIVIIASVCFIFGKYIVDLFNFLFEKFSALDNDSEDEEDEDKRKERIQTAREIRKMKEKIKEEDEKKKKKPSNFRINDEEEEEDDTPKIPDKKIIDVNPSDIRSIFSDDKEEKEEVVKEEKKESNDIHQIVVKETERNVIYDEITPINILDDRNPVKVKVSEPKEDIHEIKPVITEVAPPAVEIPATPKKEISEVSLTENASLMLENKDKVIDKKTDKPTASYIFPPINLLKKSEGGKKTSDNILEVSKKLTETLETFGVEVTIDPANCSKGPSVTRYELTPAPGVKVSRIVSLSDDIKLSLGATDIRIEAPIPGKSAVGIEVPNSESTAVPFRDLIESNDFNEAKSKITFAVGKDLAGKTVLADIAKMPHLLIAGATGSGKSVCINSIIMSILYKAHPDDVKMILIDPKVVELSVYNGIPHLLLPVVTDPKQASASLHWGVSEMEDRYKKFADAGVRDLKGYNEAADNETIKKLPQIVIIVDELADLMMVAGKEVEESICRLAQLARAAGIHLIIATQRPSVDVITGLIKANMPSRIAFSVSSGIDSRTILDSNGAEKLLGKGDMLFFPQGFTKPSRVQGCFVSDKEVSDVVDFIKNQHITGYDERVVETVKSGNSNVCQVPGGDIDDLFSQAGSFIISKEKASIGALQRAFKIGFNRAARIMDQLEAKGVVGPEEGTKPRKILMNIDEFEDLINSING